MDMVSMLKAYVFLRALSISVATRALLAVERAVVGVILDEFRLVERRQWLERRQWPQWAR